MFLTALPLVLAMSGQAPPPPQAPPAVPAAAIQKPGAPAAPRKLFNETADAKAVVAAAVRSAAEDDIRVAIVFGNNDCPRCASFGALARDPLFTVKTSDEYKIVYVDIGQGDRNADMLKAYGLTYAAESLPLLAVLDATGKILGRNPGSALASEADAAKLDAAKTSAFLKQLQAPPPPDPAPRLAAALAEAKRTDKQVLLWFSAPW